MPTPAPVMGATLAMMRSTSAKASVTSEKYEPFRPGAESHSADDSADCCTRRNADDKSEPGIHIVAHLKNGRRIGSGAEEGRVTERILPAVAAEQIPSLSGESNQERHHQKIQHYIGRGDEGHQRKQRQDAEDSQIAPSRALTEQAARAQQQHRDEHHENADLAEGLAQKYARQTFDHADEQAADQGADDRTHAAENHDGEGD